MHSLILNNIRSTHNVGSLFRTADACGVSKIYLVGYTPAPLDRFGRVVKEIAKTALGAEKTLPYEKVSTLAALVKRLKKDGFKIIAIEQSKNSVDYKKVKIRKGERVAFVLGEEVKGLTQKELSLCDVVAEIPMKGEKESLNVSVAGGVALFRILNI
jgi:tRNA G18 (ribose-2'-O)-methylase SpoU